jgi:pentatricopeptide repeat protein
MFNQSLLLGYVKNNQANQAIELFNQIQNPNEIVTTILFNACAQLGTNQALNLVKKVAEQIPKSFHSNPRLSTSLIDALMKCGDVKHAQSLFNTSSKKILAMYGAMMNGFNITNYPEKTLNLFNQMKIDGIESDYIIYVCVIKALSEIGDYSIAQSIVKQIPNDFLVNRRVQNALIDMWVSTNRFHFFFFNLNISN